MRWTHWLIALSHLLSDSLGRRHPFALQSVAACLIFLTLEHLYLEDDLGLLKSGWNNLINFS